MKPGKNSCKRKWSECKISELNEAALAPFVNMHEEEANENVSMQSSFGNVSDSWIGPQQKSGLLESGGPRPLVCPHLPPHPGCSLPGVTDWAGADGMKLWPPMHPDVLMIFWLLICIGLCLHEGEEGSVSSGVSAPVQVPAQAGLGWAWSLIVDFREWASLCLDSTPPTPKCRES